MLVRYRWLAITIVSLCISTVIWALSAGRRVHLFSIEIYASVLVQNLSKSVILPVRETSSTVIISIIHHII